MKVRTVLGDVDPGDLGAAYAHEHLIIDSEYVARELAHIHLPSVSEAVAEVEECVAAGVGAMVDAMPIGSGGDPMRLAEISAATGMHVVAATGMHTIKYYEGVDWAHSDPETLARRFVSDVEQGVEGHRAGILKVATTGPLITPQQMSLISAAGIAHEATGVPVLTHCEEGLGALEQIGALRAVGVSPDRVIVSHTDKVTDTAYHLAILATGANVEYDQSLRQSLAGSDDTARLVVAMWQAGHGRQILLGTDGARRSLWSTLAGAPGLAWLRKGFPQVLLAMGLGGAEIESMFVANPARVLAF